MDKDQLRLREMNPERALAHCAYITFEECRKMESLDMIKLWCVFRTYILNGYKDNGITVPSRFADVWLRCKSKIDREAGK